MQDQNNDEPPLSATFDTPTRPAPSPSASAARARPSPFLGCAAERLFADSCRSSDRVRRSWGERPYYRVKRMDARVSLAAVTARYFADHPTALPVVLAAKMKMGRVSMTRQERLACDFLVRRTELLSTIRNIHELMPEIEASAAEMWIAVLQDGGSQQ